jgi:carbonic anhydrase
MRSVELFYTTETPTGLLYVTMTPVGPLKTTETPTGVVKVTEEPVEPLYTNGVVVCHHDACGAVRNH